MAWNEGDLRDYILVIDLKIPPAFTDEHRNATQHGLRLGIGKQSARTAAGKTSVRPSVATVFEYDDEGEVTNIIAVADKWIVAGDFSGEKWADDEEMVTYFEDVLGDYLEAPPVALKNKTSVERKTQAEIHQMISDDPEGWSEQV